MSRPKGGRQSAVARGDHVARADRDDREDREDREGREIREPREAREARAARVDRGESASWAFRALRGQHIANASDGLDQAWRTRIVPQFSPQVRHMNIHCAIANRHVVAPRL